jgi:glucose-6-phosphate isomerase
MFPAELMGFKSSNFRRLNDLIKNKKILNSLVTNVTAMMNYSKKNYNSIIINYDQNAISLFEWYQQLVAESLGKKNKGILPIISNMPKDNHSVMQYYLDGKKNNFYTFFLAKALQQTK